MDGPVFYERVRILLHDKGQGYATPNPYWKDEEIERRALAAREVVYTTLIEQAQIKGEPVVCANNMIADCLATSGTAQPSDFYSLIMGYVVTPYRYVNPSGLPIGAAMGYTGQLDAIWAIGGAFAGTATRAIYYRTPTSTIKPNSPDFGDFPDGFYDTVITLTCIELIMGESQDAADRLDDSESLFLDQMKTLI